MYIMMYLYYKEEWYGIAIMSKSYISILRVSFNYNLTSNIEEFFKEKDTILIYEKYCCTHWDIYEKY